MTGRVRTPEQKVPSYLRGDCYYLLGAIDVKRGQHQKALGHFLEAYEGYEADQAHARLFLVGVEIANAFAAMGLDESAESWLATAFEHYRNDQDGDKKVAELGQYYLVKMDIAAARGDYEEALNFARESLKENEASENQAMLPYTLQQVGFWYGVNGCAELAAYHTDLASAAALGMGDERPTLFILVNRLLLQRITGNQVNSRLAAAVRAWAKEREDSRLEYALDQALSITLQENGFDCSSNPIDH